MSRRLSRWIPVLLALAAGLAPLPGGPVGEARGEAPALVEYRRSAEQVVLRFERRQLKIEEAGPLVLELFGDGRVVVERPAPLRPSGRFETRLPEGRVRRLLARVAVGAIVDFDGPALRARVAEHRRDQVEQARAGRAVLRSSSGDALVRLELSLTRWRPAGGEGEARRGVEAALELRRLDELSREAGGLPELEALVDAVAALDELLAEPALRGSP